MGIGTDKVNILVGDGEGGGGGKGNVFPPTLDSFSVIYPGTSEEAEADVLSFVIDAFETKTPMATEWGFEISPVLMSNVDYT